MDDKTKADLFNTFAKLNPYNDPGFAEEIRKINFQYNDGNGNMSNDMPASVAATFLRGETWSLAESEDGNPFHPVIKTSKAKPGLEAMFADAYQSLKYDTNLIYGYHGRYAKMLAQRTFNQQVKLLGIKSTETKLRDKMLEALGALANATDKDEEMFCLIQVWAYGLFASNDDSLHRRSIR
jgi:hypothetical protein